MESATKPSGYPVTFSVDYPDRDLNQAWFIGFAPADDPRVAIAVTVERTIGGQGGTVAAPIAQQVLQVLVDNSGGEDEDE